LEINPIDKEVVWLYGATNFFSTAGAVQERMPNGNTVIVETFTGRVFQVTPAGEIVWEWMGLRPAEIFRMSTYGYDYCPQFASLPRSEVAVPLPPNVRPLPMMEVGTSGN